MAQELDEGSASQIRPRDSETQRPARAKVVADASAFGPAQLKSEVTGLLAKTPTARPCSKTADEMSPEELNKTLTWLRNRAKR
jgi:hypothetical protein